jgi:8-oxo-dGTP pyrophosphatase MutT (NUDIX family)
MTGPKIQLGKIVVSLFDKERKMVKNITAAGGIVENEHKEILFMFRRGKWDLPKGKLDDGETIEECAVREVEEETGLHDVERGELIDVTMHQYEEHNVEIQKETYWYAMKVRGEQKLVPQVSEDISELKWVKENELSKYLSNSYSNIIEIVEKYYDKTNQIN